MPARIVAVVATVILVLALAAFMKDLNVSEATTFEDGSWKLRANGTWPLTGAWFD
ncbi:MAG TPA: hypothetical protein VFA32_23070 [Dehalococcoidia bacterium]|jgi:hypothetical protein|nr:hypothetical protein [Dehalococcoidia bacterium]